MLSRYEITESNGTRSLEANEAYCQMAVRKDFPSLRFFPQSVHNESGPGLIQTGAQESPVSVASQPRAQGL